MYHKAYGIIETLAPLHVGASAGEETGNLNLIFRDQFTQTGIIPGSSIRGRFRADMRLRRHGWLQEKLGDNQIEIPEKEGEINWKLVDQKWLNYLKEQLEDQNVEVCKENKIDWKLVKRAAKRRQMDIPDEIDDNYWYGYEAIARQEDGGTTEANAKFEYASLVWLPVFCPGQPIIWVTCPWLLRRYKQIVRTYKQKDGTEKDLPEIPLAYTAAKTIQGRQIENSPKVLFFNLGFIEIEHPLEEEELKPWIPPGTALESKNLLIVDNKDIGMIHDMALYRQSRVALGTETDPNMKKAKGGAFFNVEALPEGSILIFPIALKEVGWRPFQRNNSQELYFGGLESIGFGRCRVSLGGQY